jgi:hypothetical protein
MLDDESGKDVRDEVTSLEVENQKKGNFNIIHIFPSFSLEIIVDYEAIIRQGQQQNQIKMNKKENE